MKSIILNSFSRHWLGVGMLLAAAMAAQAQTAVTFQIDMASETATPVTAVYISGSFNGWPGPGAAKTCWEFPRTLLINVSGTIWSNTFTIYRRCRHC